MNLNAETLVKMIDKLPEELRNEMLKEMSKDNAENQLEVLNKFIKQFDPESPIDSLISNIIANTIKTILISAHKVILKNGGMDGQGLIKVGISSVEECLNDMKKAAAECEEKYYQEA